MSDFNTNLVALAATRAMATDAGGNPTVLGAGTTTTVLHGNAAGSPAYSAVSLTADVSGTLPIANGGTNVTTYTTGDILYASATNVLSKLGIGSTGQVLTVAAGLPSWAPGGGSGTVTSVAATVPNGLTISGSPVTTSGTLAFTNKAVTTTATSYTTLSTDYIVLVTSNAAQRTITLISAATLGSGGVQIIKDSAGTALSANSIIIATSSAQTIDGASTKQITQNFGVIRLVSDGSNWFSL